MKQVLAGQSRSTGNEHFGISASLAPNSCVVGGESLYWPIVVIGLCDDLKKPDTEQGEGPAVQMQYPNGEAGMMS